jgi:hypothetical protein
MYEADPVHKITDRPPKNATMPHWINTPWQHNLSKTASGKTGEVQVGGQAEQKRIFSPASTKKTHC